MPAARPILALTSIVLVAGGIVLQFLVILSGLGPTPLNRVYFLQASTNGIQNGNEQLQDPTRWTYLAICGVENGLNANCGPTGAAIPFDPVRNFDTEQGMPEQFLTNRNKWFYLSRVAWALFLVALFLSVIGFFVSLLAICARLGGYMAGFFVLGAFFFQTVAAALMTAWTVQARNAFQSNGLDASLGRYAYGFVWGAVAAFQIAAILLCVGGSAGKDKSSGSKSYFGRKRSTRSRGSFVDSSSDRRVVKDEYD